MFRDLRGAGDGAFWSVLFKTGLLFFAGFCFLSSSEDSSTGCTNELATAAEQAASGMNIENYAMVASVVSNTTQNISGASASTAHKANAAINSALSVAALNRWRKCTTAIAACEAACAADEGTDTSQDNESFLARCRAQSATCSSAGLQGLLSAMQSAASLLAKKKLGGCEGADCGANGGSAAPPTPEMPQASSPGSYSGQTFADSANKNNSNTPIPPSSPRSSAKSLAGFSGKPSGQPSGGPAGSSNSDDAVAASLNSDGLSDSSNASLTGGIPSKGFTKDRSSGESGNKLAGSGESGAEDSEDGDERNLRSARASAGSFTGSGRYSYSAGGRGYNSKRGMASSKLALNSASGKKSHSDRDIFAEAGSNNSASIFKRMSGFIQSFCSENAGKSCY